MRTHFSSKTASLRTLAALLFCLGALICSCGSAFAFNWETATVEGRDCVTLRSFCEFYRFPYTEPHGDYFVSNNGSHTIRIKVGSPDLHLDGVHFVMSFPIAGGDHDWLVSRMDVIKLFEPILRPEEIPNRHSIRGIVIDPGHGGADNGASNRLGMEKNYTLDTAFKLEKILKAEGLQVVLTRRTDEFVDLYERARIASQYSNFAFVSIHYNCATPEASGLETYCVTPCGSASTSSLYLSHSDGQRLPGNQDDALNILLAACVQSEIIRLNPGDQTADRGVKRARFVVIKQNVLPAILVEGGFVSNPMEARLVNADSYRQNLADAIARGIFKFISLNGGHHFTFFSNDAQANNLTVPNNTVPAPAVKPPTPVAPVAPVAATNTQIAATTLVKSHKHKTVADPIANKPVPTPATIAANQPYAPAPAAPAPTEPTTVSTLPPVAKKNNSLNLTEPAPPAPTTKDDQNAARSEPDEPPVRANDSQSTQP